MRPIHMDHEFGLPEPDAPGPDLFGSDLFGADVFTADLFDGAVPAPAPSYDDGLWVNADGDWFDVHALDVYGADRATVSDTGVSGTAALSGPGGTVVFTDLDADGVADMYHRVGPDGTFETWRFAGGEWRLLDHGGLE